jgi:hypothetical protein
LEVVASRHAEDANLELSTIRVLPAHIGDVIAFVARRRAEVFSRDRLASDAFD